MIIPPKRRAWRASRRPKGRPQPTERRASETAATGTVEEARAKVPTDLIRQGGPSRPR